MEAEVNQTNETCSPFINVNAKILTLSNVHPGLAHFVRSEMRNDEKRRTLLKLSLRLLLSKTFWRAFWRWKNSNDKSGKQTRPSKIR